MTAPDESVTVPVTRPEVPACARARCVAKSTKADIKASAPRRRNACMGKTPEQKG